jgi:AraC-like DNA-binding protein
VGCLWYWEGAPTTHARERLLPNGECAIIVNLRDDPMRIYDARNITRYNSYGHAVLSGARSDCFVIDTSQEERVVGIQFRAGGAFPFFRMPASEAEGGSMALDDLWPGRVSEIREQLLAAPDVDAMFAILERSLLEQLARPPELHPAVAYAIRRFCHGSEGGSVAAVTERVGLSPRRFIELFHRQVGLTPKTFSRVRRFQQALRSFHGRREIDWAQVALENGYYDQAHFIHDFQSFSGFTPNVYSTLATPHLNHVPLP